MINVSLFIPQKDVDNSMKPFFRACKGYETSNGSFRVPITIKEQGRLDVLYELSTYWKESRVSLIGTEAREENATTVICYPNGRVMIPFYVGNEIVRFSSNKSICEVSLLHDLDAVLEGDDVLSITKYELHLKKRRIIETEIYKGKFPLPTHLVNYARAVNAALDKYFDPQYKFIKERD